LLFSRKNPAPLYAIAAIIQPFTERRCKFGLSIIGTSKTTSLRLAESCFGDLGQETTWEYWLTFPGEGTLSRSIVASPLGVLHGRQTGFLRLSGIKKNFGFPTQRAVAMLRQ
jgi:hypothetical protein